MRFFVPVIMQETVDCLSLPEGEWIDFINVIAITVSIYDHNVGALHRPTVAKR